jgi:hypothetical protein
MCNKIQFPQLPLPPKQQTTGGSRVAAGSAGVPVAYVASSPSLSPPKTKFFWLCYRGISDPSPKPTTNTKQPEQQHLRNSWLLPCLLTPANLGERRCACIRMPPILWWLGGHPLGCTMIMPYDAEMRDKMSWCAAVDALDFWHCYHWIWKRKAIHGTFWTISCLWRQGDKGGGRISNNSIAWSMLMKRGIRNVDYN